MGHPAHPRAPATNDRRDGYARRKPEASALHRVVRENLLTLYAAIEQGFASPLPKFLSPARGPPFFRSPAVRRKLGELDGEPRQLEIFGT